jgi:hypothetical protein
MSLKNRKTGAEFSNLSALIQSNIYDKIYGGQ